MSKIEVSSKPIESATCSRLGFRLEVPMWAEEARQRLLPEAVARLLVFPHPSSCRGDGDSWNALSEWMWSCRGDGEHVLAWPILPYQSQKGIETALQRTGLMVKASEVNGDWIIHCENPREIATVISVIRSEVTVFVFGRSESALRETIAALDRGPSNYPSFEVPLTQKISDHGAFVFFNADHNSLEMIGTEQFVRTVGARMMIGP